MARSVPPPGDEPQLTKEQLEALLVAVARLQRRRRIELAGYLLAALVLVLGMLLALAVVGNAPPGAFRQWVFLIPLTLVALIFWSFGRWARRGGGRP